MGSEHRKCMGVDNWMSAYVDIPLMSLKDIEWFSTSLCVNTPWSDVNHTAMERAWYALRVEAGKPALIERIVSNVVWYENEV